MPAVTVVVRFGLDDLDRLAEVQYVTTDAIAHSANHVQPTSSSATTSVVQCTPRATRAAATATATRRRRPAAPHADAGAGAGPGGTGQAQVAVAATA